MKVTEIREGCGGPQNKSTCRLPEMMSRTRETFLKDATDGEDDLTGM